MNYIRLNNAKAMVINLRNLSFTVNSISTELGDIYERRSEFNKIYDQSKNFNGWCG
jgi:hypothetical protein